MLVLDDLWERHPNVLTCSHAFLGPRHQLIAGALGHSVLLFDFLGWNAEVVCRWMLAVLLG